MDMNESEYYWVFIPSKVDSLHNYKVSIQLKITKSYIKLYQEIVLARISFSQCELSACQKVPLSDGRAFGPLSGLRIVAEFPTHSPRALTQNRAKSARDANDSSTNPLGPWAFFTVYRSCAISIQNFVQLVHSLPEWSSVEGSGRSGFAIATHLRFKRQQQQTTKKSTQKQGGKQSEKNRARGRGKSVEHEQSNTIVK